MFQKVINVFVIYDNGGTLSIKITLSVKLYYLINTIQ